MKFRSILIITYGRSGSTLLQGILNSIDGCVIRGENGNFCYYLFKAYQALILAHSNKGETVESPWFGNRFLNKRQFLAHCKLQVHRFLLGDHFFNAEKINTFGFKEIRYSHKHISNDFDEYLEFLTKIFPDVAFLFNTRKLDDVSKSGWWKNKKKEEVIIQLKATEENFYAYLKKHPENSFHIRYEDVVKKSPRLKEMFDFLGIIYNPDDIDRVLAKPHSYKTIN